ncbi:sugar transporter protein [Asimina triloba]
MSSSSSHANHPQRSKARPSQSSGSRHHHHRPTDLPRAHLKRLLRVASIACGVQFGWALQLCRLTPYVQELGIPHAWASLIWLCGPLSGFVVQPLVGHMSDRCNSRFGRRRPFIAVGTAAIAASVLVIGHSADIGWLLGDQAGASIRPRAIVAFVIGFWLLDVANNTTQAPCRALLADLAGKDQRRTRIANAYFSLFMAVGNILGYAAGAYNGWYAILPFTITTACGINCANLKSTFLLDIVFLIITTCISISAAQEQPISHSDGLEILEEQQQSDHGQEAFLWELLSSFRFLTLPIWIVLIVIGLTWIGWFPFFLYDTDWMGREIYGGSPDDGQSYYKGVSMGSLGLMLNSILLGLTSLGIEKMCRKWGSGLVLGVSNIMMSLCFVSMLIISSIANKMDRSGHSLPPDGIVIAALAVFSLLGVPLAVVVSLGSGPWDQLFGGGNSPAFAVAAVAGFVSGLVAILGLPRSRTEKPRIIH